MQELKKVGQGYKLISYEFNKQIVIPGNWALMKLTETCDILDAQRIPIEESERKRRKGNFPYYGASGIIDCIDDFIFNEKLLCLAEDGENLRSRVLPVAFIIEGKTWVNNHAHVLKPKANVADVKYLEYFLNHKKYEKYLSFTAQPKLTQEEMKKILVILPPLIEQRKIASILSKVHELIKKIDQIIEETQRLKKGLMKRLFTKGTGHNKFKNTVCGDIPVGWEVCAIGEKCKVGSGGTPSRTNPSYFSGNIPWVKTTELKYNTILDTEEKITERAITESSAKVYPKGTFVIAMVGLEAVGTRGKCAILGIDAACQPGLCSNPNANHY